MIYSTSCYAKLNLFLAVGPIDDRGYHPLRTVFQTVGLADEIKVDFSASDDTIDATGADLPDENTLSKTLRLTRELIEVPPLRITLKKVIPMESGLGGGSSNAAGLLRILGRRFDPALNPQAMFEIACAVGCDVPFFLVGGTARGEGYGEDISPLPDLPTNWAVIVKPEIGVSSGTGYAALDRQEYTWRDFDTDPMVGYNDFERVMPCISGDAIERLLSHGAMSANLTGSGSAVFGLVGTEFDADRIKNAMESEGLGQVFAVPFVGRSSSIQVNAS